MYLSSKLIFTGVSLVQTLLLKLPLRLALWLGPRSGGFGGHFDGVLGVVRVGGLNWRYRRGVEVDGNLLENLVVRKWQGRMSGGKLAARRQVTKLGCHDFF